MIEAAPQGAVFFGLKKGNAAAKAAKAQSAGGAQSDPVPGQSFTVSLCRSADFRLRHFAFLRHHALDFQRAAAI